VDERLRIIITGGTFDKDYDELKGELTFRDSHLPQIVKQIRLGMPVELEICELKDSLEMGDRDREVIADACAVAPEQRIVIVHGTDTMVETAHLIDSRQIPRTIVLTGAMIPYAILGSDAVFNLGCAVAATQTMPYGVYIAMNGTIFPARGVRKNRELGRFEHL
jgi:L-asparaginase